MIKKALSYASVAVFLPLQLLGCAIAAVGLGLMMGAEYCGCMIGIRIDRFFDRGSHERI
mgnify:CR=1 FL=1